MRNVVCWDPREVRGIINPYAENTPDAHFRAVHADWALKVSPPMGKSFQDLTPAAFEDMAPSALLADFLREDRPYVLAVVLGRAGSGKSHLVHWMRLNIPETPQRLVLVVRKSGTSLRAIIEMIISKLPSEEQQGFRDTLNRAGDAAATRGGQKERLLNELAQAIREDVPADPSNEVEEALLECLPHVFQDPHMRAAHFLRDGTIIADLVDHVFAQSNAANRPDERRVFTEQDLPLGGHDFRDASRLTRDAIQLIDLDRSAHLPLAIDIINRNLNKAIARTLSFSGSRLEELMGRLRTHLKRQKRELVVLIEEFARLQGIDRDLLQAITDQGKGDFCRIRTALAVTTGFFRTVAETAYMRTTHIVDMDLSAGNAGVTAEQALADFASRYLNAVRIGPNQLDVWHANAGADDPAPSRCDRCDYKPSCHAAFGAANGYGLYPFTAKALLNAAQRVDRGARDSFNPRIVQNEILAPVLDTHEPAIRAGEFPPPRFLEKLGGGLALDLMSTDRIERLVPGAAKRVITFLELYDGSGRIENLDDQLRSAFGIPAIPGAEDAAPERAVELVRPAEEPGPLTDPNAGLLQAWARGGEMDPNLANRLRPLIFQAVVEAIDWDALGLERTSFANPVGSRPFRQQSIVFYRQTTQVPAHILVRLTVPGPLDPTRTALALQGLLKAVGPDFRWSFAGGGEMFAAFLDCLAGWSADVEQQLRALAKTGPSWDPAVAAYELLGLGAALLGRVKSDATVPDILEAALKDWGSQCAAESAELQSIYARLLRHRQMLVDFARAHSSAMKGGQVRSMLDPRLPARSLRALRRGKWRLRQLPPGDLRGDYAEIAKIYSDVAVALEAAAEAERSARLVWLQEIESAFGSTATRAMIVDALTGLYGAAAARGVAGRQAKPLKEALETFASVPFDDALAAARGLADESDAVVLLPQYGRMRRPAVIAASDLRQRADAFVADVEQNLALVERDVELKYGGLTQSINLIETSLSAIEAALVLMSAAEQEDIHAA